MNLPAKLALGAGALLAGSQLWPLDQSNPPERYDRPILGGAQEKTLQEVCFPCHANRTDWPWYSRVTPVRFLVTHDVREGRRELNFDDWGELAPDRRAKLLRKAAEEIREGEMPTPPYLIAHPEARLSEARKQALASALAAAAN